MNTFYHKQWIYFLFRFLITRRLLVFALLVSSFSFSQTTNISGIVNTYHSVLSVITSNAAVKVDNTAGLAYGNTVLLIQMKGASIITTNTSAFGDTTSLNYAGNYELATICSVSNDTVYFFNEILNSYDINYKVQLVKFGEYYSANVTDTLKAQAWNSTTGKGGVLAIKVEEDITLNAPVFVDSTGYKGGSFYLHSGTCGFLNPAGNGYAYDATSATSNNGAYKGEGVADVPSNLDGARGAPANGGGGGNNHNNGGGGGANLYSGGNGGGNFSTGPSGCNSNYQGRGGKALNNWSNSKIFLGGGGGAGHANNTVQPYAGGNGGGIIIIIGKNIIGNGYKISANGQAGRSTSYDGASGGGSGGTIIMNITNSFTGPLFIEANGGNGGNEDDDLSAGRCYGAGGGGSGGVIYFSGAVPVITTTVIGGIAGINIDVNSCGVPIPAISGTNGVVNSNYSYRTSITPSSSCIGGALPVKIIYFNASLVTDKKIKLEWDITNPEEVSAFTIEKINFPNHWNDLKTIDAETDLHHYEFFDETPETGDNYYRLRINGKDNSKTYSVLKKVQIKYNNQFIVYPNPAKNKITVAGKFTLGDKLQLNDISGRTIFEKTINFNNQSLQFDLPSLPPGIYLLKIKNVVEKLIIR